MLHITYRNINRSCRLRQSKCLGDCQAIVVIPNLHKIAARSQPIGLGIRLSTLRNIPRGRNLVPFIVISVSSRSALSFNLQDPVVALETADIFLINQ